MMAGVFLIAMGYLRIGTYIKFIPYPVTVGFTAGIAVIIFASQIKELLGLTLAGKEPGAFLPKVVALAEALGTVNPAAAFLSALTIATIIGLKRWRPGWPGMLIAVGLAALAAALLSLPVETIGHALWRHTAQAARALDPGLQPADGSGRAARRGRLRTAGGYRIATVGGGRRRHDWPSPPLKLRAGGARLRQSQLGPVRRHCRYRHDCARRPTSGPAPMARFRACRTRSSCLVTFGLVVFRDLTEAIVVGFALGSVLFIDRMAKAIAVEAHVPVIGEDVADSSNGGRTAYDASQAGDADTVIYRIPGAFFFGAASTVGAVLDRIADQRKNFILDCSGVPFLDSTAANVLEGAARKARRSGVRFVVVGASPQVRRTLITHGVKRPLVSYAASVGAALASPDKGSAEPR
jgi:SulP family sulfate permease